MTEIQVWEEHMEKLRAMNEKLPDVEVSHTYDPVACCHTWQLRIPDCIMADYHPTPFDRGFLKECERSGSIADILLGLSEIIRTLERKVNANHPST